MIKFFCDRCENEVPKVRTYVKVLDQNCDTPIGVKPEYLLCPKCYCELVSFLGGKPKCHLK